MAAGASRSWATASEKAPFTTPGECCCPGLHHLQSTGDVLNLMTLANREPWANPAFGPSLPLPPLPPCIRPSIPSFRLSFLCFFLPLSSSFLHSLTLIQEAVTALLWVGGGQTWEAPLRAPRTRRAGDSCHVSWAKMGCRSRKQMCAQGTE